MTASTGIPDSEGPLVVPVGPAGESWVSFAPGNTGWAIYRSPGYDLGERNLFVRVSADRSDDARRDDPPARVTIREVLMSFAEGVGPRALRDVPLSRIEAALNQPTYRDRILERIPTSASAVMVGFPFGAGTAEDLQWFTHMPDAALRISTKLQVPEGRGRPDDFYRDVADAFMYLSTVSQRPATDLATVNDVPVTTVHGWVKEARRRGLLPSGERSRKRG